MRRSDTNNCRPTKSKEQQQQQEQQTFFFAEAVQLCYQTKRKQNSLVSVKCNNVYLLYITLRRCFSQFTIKGHLYKRQNKVRVV